MKFQKVGLLALLILSACGPDRVELLSDRVELYNRRFRFGMVPGAGAMVDEKVRKSIIEKIVNILNRNQIVDFSILDLGVDEKKRSASVIVEYSYYPLSDQTLRQRREIQAWNYNGDQNEWFLASIRELSPTP